jgi:hypothetical protein
MKIVTNGEKSVFKKIFFLKRFAFFNLFPYFIFFFFFFFCWAKKMYSRVIAYQ